jgi:glucose-6-phosphate-specific signal transduction histidine kinase
VSKNYKSIASAVLILFFVVNIAEACSATKDPMILASGIILCISAIINYRQVVITTQTIDSKLSWMFIIAYTFWNFGFRIQLSENTSIIPFTIVSLILPVIAKIYGYDWLQIRSITLLFVMIITFGINSGNILPMYNKNVEQLIIADKFKQSIGALSLMFSIGSLV